MVAAVNVSQDSEGAPHTQQQLSTLILTAHAQPCPVVGAGRTYRQHCVKLQLSLVGLQLLTTLSFAINTIQKNRLLSEPVRCFKGLGPGSVSQALPAHGMVLRRLGGLASHGGMLDALPAHCNVLHTPGGLEVFLRPCLAASRACRQHRYKNHSGWQPGFRLGFGLRVLGFCWCPSGPALQHPWPATEM
jgi:hypothetical protein